MSSKLLLDRARHVKNLHTDATYKLIWQGFPVLLVGPTDKNKKFHPMGVCVTTGEKAVDFEFMFRSLLNASRDILGADLKPNFLICDAAKSIHNGFRSVFGESNNKIMCWAHARRNVVKQLPKFIRQAKVRNEFMNDLDHLQLARTPSEFDVASTLFVNKWKLVSDDLMAYFSNEWLTRNRNWFEGFAKFAPSTNNALESFNRVIKDEHTLRERLDISRFRIVMANMIRQWSKEYVHGLNSADFETTRIDLKTWTAGYQFARSNISAVSSHDDNRITYTFSAADVRVNNPWQSFEDYRHSLVIVKTVFIDPITEENWMSAECDCGIFLKNYMCEHIIGIALRLKRTFAPPEAKTVPIGQKRKRGRPAKCKPALIIQ